MVIAVDFDGVMNNMLDVWLKELNKLSNKSYTICDVKEWNLKILYPELTTDEIFSILETKEFWQQVREQKDCAYYLKKFIDAGIKVVVVTNSCYKTLQNKLEHCLFRLFPFLTIDDIIITSQKYLIQCDYMIDDYEKNLEKFSSDTYRLLYVYPYNSNASWDQIDARVYTWEQIYEYIINNVRYREENSNSLPF